MTWVGAIPCCLLGHSTHGLELGWEDVPPELLHTLDLKRGTATGGTCPAHGESQNASLSVDKSLWYLSGRVAGSQLDHSQHQKAQLILEEARESEGSRSQSSGC